MTRLLRLGAFVLAACCPPAPAKPVVALPAPALPAKPVVAPVEPAKPTGPQPPKAATRAHDVPSPNGARPDPYYWIRDDNRKDPDVLGYLNAENAYTTAALAPAAQLETTLFTELRGRVKEDDSSVPVFDNGYWYYSRFETGKQQPIHARKKGKLDAPEQILLDGNALATGHEFYRIGRLDVSRDNKLLAWTDDSVGRNQFALHIKKIESGEVLADTATNVAPSVEWANDNQTVFLVGKDETTLREDRIFRHKLGGTNELVFKEDDGSYYVDVGGTKSHRYVQITLSATTNNEVRLIDANKPAAAPIIFLPREKDHLYSIDHLDNRFVMLTNKDAKNFRVVEIPEGKQANPKAWKDVIPHRTDALVEDVAVYRGFMAASVRTGGLSKVEVLPKGKPSYFLDAPEPTYTMSVGDTPDPDAKRVRFIYSSLVQPASTYEADIATKQKTLLKQQEVPGYDSTKYASEYLHAPASDGTQVPISVVYKKGTKLDGSAPLYVYGYGSYGISSDPYFNSSVVSLLDRGWVYAVVHVRGGSEMGRAWYEDGRQQHKRNTFTDFIAGTEFLIAQKYAARDQVVAEGASAGGLLMGAITNLRPDLFRGVIARVPFVDVVTTMLDESIPLTTNEFDEWGNPKEKAAYDYMLSYSPYDNITVKAYPSVFVHTGLWDSQVQYYEPTKYVAKLRATKTDDNLVILDIDMTSGHGGASGRFDALKQRARSLAFALYVHDRPDGRKGWPN